MTNSLLLSLSVAATVADLPTAYLTLTVILATVHTQLNNLAKKTTHYSVRGFLYIYIYIFLVTVLLFPVDSDALSDGQAQRGMDRYLDSLFDPVLSDSNMVSSDSTVDMLKIFF